MGKQKFSIEFKLEVIGKYEMGTCGWLQKACKDVRTFPGHCAQLGLESKVKP